MLSRTLDQLDHQIIEILQREARLTNSELAERVGLSGPGVQKRLKKLEESGVLRRYVALADPEALGYDMVCFVQVTLQRHEPSAVQGFRAAVRTIPEILECYHLTGEFDYLLKVVLRNRKHLERFLLDVITPLPGMDKIRTSVVLSEIKATTALPTEDS